MTVTSDAEQEIGNFVWTKQYQGSSHHAAAIWIMWQLPPVKQKLIHNKQNYG